MLLEYVYEPGETLRYRQAVQMVLENPDLDPMEGRAELDVTVQVTGGTPEGWTLEVRLQLLHAEGLLAEHIPSALRARSFRMAMDRRGRVLQTTGGPPSTRLPEFPDHPVQPGDSWTVREGGRAPLDLEYRLAGLGPDGARLESRGTIRGPEEGVNTEIRAATLFGQGRLLDSSTTIDTAWSNGRAMKMTVDYRLL